MNDPEAVAIRRRASGEQRFFMTGPGGVCSISLFPRGRWLVYWTGSEANWGEFMHQDMLSAIRRALDFGCDKLELLPEVDDERMKRIWQLIGFQAKQADVEEGGRLLDT